MHSACGSTLKSRWLATTIFLHFFSDNCTGQNRNRIVTMFSFVMKNYASLDKIEHCFLEVGHTQNENDSVHSEIAETAKKIPVYTPEQWATVVRGARRNMRPYSVKEMSSGDFFAFKEMSKGLKNIDLDEEDEKVAWSRIRVIAFNRVDKDAMIVRYYSGCCRVDLMRLVRRKRNSDNEKSVFDFQQLVELAGITKDKQKDLISLCTSNLIPPAHPSYFHSLPTIP